MNSMPSELLFSKSKYCSLWQCPKLLWLQENKPEAAETDSGAAMRMEAGHKVGEIARGLFGSFVDVTAYRNGKLDKASMESRTIEEMEKDTPTICEASFNYHGLYCAVDILRKEEDGWAIYEVKSSTKAKGVYLADVSYQLYVLEHCGVKVTGVYLIIINRDYVFDGDLKLSELFKIRNVTRKAKKELCSVEENLQEAAHLLSSPNEPNIPISKACRNPYSCPYQNYCKSELPESERENQRPDYIDPMKLKHFLQQLQYPLYFLDLETLQPVIPRYIGTRPYDQIPFQYSLHYIEYENGPLLHKEFLASPGTDPRRALASSLCKDIPAWACVTAYNKVFECTRLSELAIAFPDLSNHLTAIEHHIVDLLVPFRNGWLYKQAMSDSFSIKSVLPALYPNDPSLDYHNLEGIHNGTEAMAAFPAMEHMTPKQQAESRKSLLAYCKLDTYAMVKLWEALTKAANSTDTI